MSPFNARPDASLTVIFDSLPSGVSGMDATPLGEEDSVKVDSVEVDSIEVLRWRFAAGSASSAIRCSSFGQRAWIMARFTSTDTPSLLTSVTSE